MWAVPSGILLAVTAGAIVWYLHVPMFRATVLVKIESAAPYIAFEKGISNQNTDRYVQTQIELLRGPVVLGPVLSRPEIASIEEVKSVVDPIAFVRDRLSVNQVGSSDLYQVSFVSPSPGDAATMANSIVAEFLVTQDREDRQRAQMVIDVLENERLQRGIKVEQLREQVVNLAKDLTGRDPFGQGVITDMAAFVSTTSINQNLNEVDVDIAMRSAELQALRNAPIVAADMAVASGLLELEVANRPDVRQLEARIDDIRREVEAVKAKPRTRIGDNWESDPQYIELQTRLQLANTELKGLKEVAGKGLINLRLEERKVDQQRSIAGKELELSLLRKKREYLASKFERQREDLRSGGEKSTELEFAKGELAREEAVFEMIAARKLALQTELRAPARVSLMQSAKAPSIALEPIPYKLLLVACLASLVMPVALTIAHEMIIRRVSSPEELAKESLLPLLGEVTRFPMRQITATHNALPTAQQRQLFVYAESIDSLRTKLMLTGNLGVPGQSRVIAICSAASGEGKTSVATSLAMSIAEATKQPTLILDADLRSPDVGNFLEVPNHPGVAEVLCGKAALAQAIHRVGATQAYVLPAGKHRVNPHHILHGSKIDELLGTLREKFSTIIIDTPPVLSASESLVYAQAADLVVLCSLADVSRATQVRAAVNRLQSTGANVAGAVLSGVPFNRYVYQYGTYERNG
jgi:capsular exopolysaccharide synthesis family protein